MLDRSSQESEGLTSDLNGPDTQSPSNAKPMPSAEKSSEGIGPKSQSTKTFKAWDSLNHAASPEVPTMGQNTGMATGRAGVIFQSTSYAEDSPAKTSPLQANELDSRESEVDSSTKPPESLTLFSATEAGFSLRMFPDSFPHKTEEISESFSRRWPNSGFMTSPGECWTVDTSECRSDGGVSSSLPDVLEADVAPRFYLSQRAAAGILRRAEKRGRELPPHLDNALRTLSTGNKEGRTTTQPKSTTSSPPSSVRRLTPTECERLQGFPDGWTVP